MFQNSIILTHIVSVIINFQKYLNYLSMQSKSLKDSKVWDVDGFTLHLEFYKSKIIIKDEEGNILKISKKEPLSMILNLIGNFKSD